MAMSTTVFASSVSTGNMAVSGNGTTEYINVNDYYEVCLPTETALNFKLDPQGLLGLAPGEFGTLESLSENAGKVVGTTSSCIINESALPIKVTVSMAIVGKAATDVKVVSDVASVSADKLNNILVYAIPCKDSIAVSANYSSASQGFILKQAAAADSVTLTGANTDALTFVLDAAQYTASRNAAGDAVTYNKTGDGNGTGIMLGGLVNPSANWIDFAKTTPTKTVGFRSIFAFGPVDGTETVDSTKGYGFVSAKTAGAASDLGTIAVEAQTSSTGPITINATKGSTSNIVTTLGGTVKSLKLVKLGAVAKSSVLGATHYTAAGKTLTIKGSWASALTETAILEATVEVNGTDIVQKITINFN